MNHVGILRLSLVVPLLDTNTSSGSFLVAHYFCNKDHAHLFVDVKIRNCCVENEKLARYDEE